jgi:hypothetical protein
MPRANDRKIEGLAAQARRLALRGMQQQLRAIARKLDTLDEEENGDPAPPTLDGLDERDLELIRLVHHKANYAREYMAALVNTPLPNMHRMRKKLFNYFGVLGNIELVRLLDDQDG